MTKRLNRTFDRKNENILGTMLLNSLLGKTIRKTPEEAGRIASQEAFKRAKQRIDTPDAEQWDVQIEQDAKAGKLDALAKAAFDDHKAGKTTKL